MNNDTIPPIERLKEIMARLRDPESGCPWDIEQNFDTIAPYTIEEAFEVADAIEQKDMASLKDELGDLLLQVVYHAQMAAEMDEFVFDDVVAAISDKMVRRHPHVFGNDSVESSAAQTLAWEEQKARERAGNQDNGVLDGVAKGFPALLRAYKLQKRAARVGFDWPEATGALAKLHEELEELTVEMNAGDAGDAGDARENEEKLLDEFGDVLFSAVNLARKLNIDPEAALRHGNAKFERRFRDMETSINETGGKFDGMSLDEMEALWRQSKING